MLPRPRPEGRGQDTICLLYIEPYRDRCRAFGVSTIPPELMDRDLALGAVGNPGACLSVLADDYEGISTHCHPAIGYFLSLYRQLPDVVGVGLSGHTIVLLQPCKGVGPALCPGEPPCDGRPVFQNPVGIGPILF